jgi:radical SAM protein with 4Fe4S-binding SPASM domain
MSDKEQIAQMARDICHLPRRCEECDIARINKGKCQARTYAERAYAKGWRKDAEERSRR